MDPADAAQSSALALALFAFPKSASSLTFQRPSSKYPREHRSLEPPTSTASYCHSHLHSSHHQHVDQSKVRDRPRRQARPVRHRRRRRERIHHPHAQAGESRRLISSSHLINPLYNSFSIYDANDVNADLRRDLQKASSSGHQRDSTIRLSCHGTPHHIHHPAQLAYSRFSNRTCISHICIIDIHIYGGDLLMVIVGHRAPETSESIPRSTRKSGKVVSKACPSDYASGSPANATTRRAPRRNCIVL